MLRDSDGLRWMTFCLRLTSSLPSPTAVTPRAMSILQPMGSCLSKHTNYGTFVCFTAYPECKYTPPDRAVPLMANGGGESVIPAEGHSASETIQKPALKATRSAWNVSGHIMQLGRGAGGR